jgi:hypothetical protein
MKETLELRTPIEINGKKVKTLTYDTEEITAQAFINADSLASQGSGNGRMNTSMVEFDKTLQLYLAYEAIIAINPDIDISDLKRIKGRDILAVADIGRNFILRDSEEPSEAEPSDEPSAPIVESIAPQKTKSEKGE